MGKKLPNMIVGWREMVELPELKLGPIQAKVDTGARTSSLHATHIKQIVVNGSPAVHFRAHLDSSEPEKFTQVTALLHDVRAVRNSGGDDDDRFVIKTPMRIGERTFQAEITLADRSSMRYPILIGRTALRVAYFLVDSNKSYLHAKPPGE